VLFGPPLSPYSEPAGGLNSPTQEFAQPKTPRQGGGCGLFSWCQSRRSSGSSKMDTTTKGGLQFAVLYRGQPMLQSPRQQGQDVGMDATSKWASGRIGEARTFRPQPSDPSDMGGRMPGDASISPTDVTANICDGSDCSTVDPYDNQNGFDDSKGSTVTVDRGTNGDGSVTSADASAKARVPIPPGRKIHWNELGDGGLSDMKFLGAGEFCSVFSSVIDGGKPIAVKMLRPNKLASESAARDLEFEMHLMSRMSHRHILRCIGTSVPNAEPDRKFLALQTLVSTLHDALPQPPLPDGSSTLIRLNALKRWPVARALQLGLELAIAVRYLHYECFANYRLLHRDIKPKNLGLMEDGRLVVFDFGISKLMSRSTELERFGLKMTGMCGSLRYMAPEVAMHKPYNHLSEVYSFSIVLWEMLALRRPFETVTSNDFEVRVCVRHERPKLNMKKWSPQLCNLLSSCWAPDFAERPDFTQVVDEMMTLVSGESTFFSRQVHGMSGMHPTQV